MHDHADHPHHNEHNTNQADGHRDNSRGDLEARGTSPRTAAPDDDMTGIPKPSETGSDQPVWCSDQSRKRGGYRRYSGHINYIHGPAADRRRGELAAAVADLLDWAARHQSESATDTDDVSSEGW